MKYEFKICLEIDLVIIIFLIKTVFNNSIVSLKFSKKFNLSKFDRASSLCDKPRTSLLDNWMKHNFIIFTLYSEQEMKAVTRKIIWKSIFIKIFLS